MSILLAAIRAATPVPALSGPPTASPPVATPSLIRDIAGPVLIPLPVWLVILLSVLAVMVLAGLAYGLYRAAQRQPAPVPPRPRAVALQELERLRAQVKTMGSYEFSIAVSHILRRFVETQFGIPALEQTSPEFLADIAQRSTFVTSHQTLLGEFLERCDALKFGGVEGDEVVNEGLVGSATAFVQGGAL